MTSRRLMFIQLSQLTRCPLYVSPFLSSTNWTQMAPLRAASAPRVRSSHWTNHPNVLLHHTGLSMYGGHQQGLCRLNTPLPKRGGDQAQVSGFLYGTFSKGARLPTDLVRGSGALGRAASGVLNCSQHPLWQMVAGR